MMSKESPYSASVPGPTPLAWPSTLSGSNGRLLGLGGLLVVHGGRTVFQELAWNRPYLCPNSCAAMPTPVACSQTPRPPTAARPPQLKPGTELSRTLSKSYFTSLYPTAFAA